jgi:hypothetical protein
MGRSITTLDLKVAVTLRQVKADATRSVEFVKVKTERGVTPIWEVAQIRVTG